ncbi:MAG: DNA polymerase III subunit gamma/tau [Acidobacteria bacterium]|nr:DNA polymerase III subunit gamma/tau [Acidobacteriota bacterium]
MSYQVIARKYRPQVFDEVVGQRLITDTLKNAIQSNRVAHGYIFSGARGVGKTSTARILAKSLNCVEGPTVAPCGTCPSCLEIAAGNSVDVFEIDAASNRGIDEIRELRETVRYLPARDRYKVFIIDEVHMLTTEAFNALLKTLEEPPPRSLFLLATTEPHKLPATIQSRCQHFAFRLLEYAEIYSRLEQVCAAEKIRADEGSLSAVAQAAEGSLRDALSLLDQVIAACGAQLEEARVRQLLGVVPVRFLREMVEAVHAGDAQLVLERVGELAKEGYELAHFAGEFTRYIRSLMIAKSCGAESPLLQVPTDERRTLAELAGLFSEEDLTRFFQILLRTEGDLRYSLAPRFHLEMGLLKLVHAGKLASLELLLGELRGARPAEKPAGPPPRPALPGPTPRDSAKAQESGPPQSFAPARKAVSLSSPPMGTAEGALALPEDARLAAIKSMLYDQSKKFLSSCLEHLSGWRFENGEVRFLCPKKESWVAEFLKSREQLETLRSVCAQVLGQPIKICVTLEEPEGQTAAARPQARDRASRDAGVEAFRKRFDCTVVDVKDLSQE